MYPDSVALGKDHLYVVDSVCAESFPWPWGSAADGTVSLGDVNAAQIAVGWTWAAVTLKDNKLYQLPLAGHGALSGTYTPVTLLSGAELVPLGEAFWGDVLGFTPAHDTHSFAIVSDGTEYPILGPTPPYGPTPPFNAPCWVAKGPGNLWYTGNSPGHAISIFFTDSKGGEFYKSVILEDLTGVPTDITVSPDGKWLAVIYTDGSDGYVAVYSIDKYGDLTYVATSTYSLPSTISGVAIVQ
jgi:WD40 repeat protein